MKRKILILSAGRSDIGRYMSIIEALKNNKKIEIGVFLSSAHLNPKVGKTKKNIFKNLKIFRSSVKSFYDTKYNILKNFSKDLIKISIIIKKFKPNLIIVLGDRYEMLKGPLISIVNKIPCVHFYGGAVTEGAFDDLIRHAITKMSHYHFVLTDVYRDRLIQLGEEKSRIKVTGMLNLIDIKKNLINKSLLSKKIGFQITKPYILFTYHPETLGSESIEFQLNQIYRLVRKLDYKVIISSPNVDPGYEQVLNFYKKKFNDESKYLFKKNIGDTLFFSLMKNAAFVLGNSSSGIVEASFLKVPTVNLGIRQKGKVFGKNVINSDFKLRNMIKAIKFSQDDKFKTQLSKSKSPYEPRIKHEKLANYIIKIIDNKKNIYKKFVDL